MTAVDLSDETLQLLHWALGPFDKTRNGIDAAQAAYGDEKKDATIVAVDSGLFGALEDLLDDAQTAYARIMIGVGR